MTETRGDVGYETFRVPVRGGDLAGGVWNAGAEGMPVLAIHGISASHRTWPLLAGALPEVRIVAPDLRGRGRSNALPPPWDIRDHADDMAALLDAFGIERAVVVGHSMGGFVAVRTADQHPDRVAALVLIDGGLPLPFSVPDDVPESEVPSYLLGPAGERLSRVFATREEYTDFWRAHPAFRDHWNDEIAAYIDYDLDEVDGGFRPSSRFDAVATNIVQQDGGDGYVDALGRLRVPVDFLHAPRGLLDAAPLYPEAVVDAAPAMIQDFRRHEIDDVNHYSIVLTEHGMRQVAPIVRDAVDGTGAGATNAPAGTEDEVERE